MDIVKPGRNLLKTSKQLLDFKSEGLHYSVSSRNIKPHFKILDFLKIFYPFIRIDQIESVFGSTVFQSPLYGGRRYNQKASLNKEHEQELIQNDIHISLTLTNHHFTKELYEQTLPLLEKYHTAKNSVICVNDELARQIRSDFPDYSLRASIIKNINSLRRVEEQLKCYDYVVIPMDKNDDDGFLLSLPEKHRIMLFGNATCAYTCPARTCYKGFSDMNLGNQPSVLCSKESVERLNLGSVFFDVRKFKDMGFSYIKLVPYTQKRTEMILKFFSRKKIHKELNRKADNAVYIASYPKSGRTWLRFILANYYNLYFDINEDINLKNMFEFMPNNDLSDIKGYTQYRFKNREDVPLILFTHDKYNHFQYKNKRIVYLKRNPLDAIVSYYFHIRFNPGYIGSISEFIRDPKYGIERLLKFDEAWRSELSHNHLMISYEEMHENTEAVVREVLNYIGLDINEDYLKKAVEKSDFETMKKGELTNPVPGFEKQRSKEDMRMRKGKTNNYKNYLSADDISLCSEIIKSFKM